MAGRIKREDVDLVRERAKIDEVVGTYVTLKGAGSGSLKGLCPFHDERTPSFHVRPHLGLWHCFGCGEGGDVFSFMQKIDGLGFTEAVELLAGRYGVTLRYEGADRPSERIGTRQRLLAVNRAAWDFFQEQLETPAAAAAREFLTSRGFDAAAARMFGVGFAPPGWDSVGAHLRAQSFTVEELNAAGLVSQGKKGFYDRFRGRLIWPIRDVAGEVLGFGARRLFEDDQGPKYLNTPETALYKKSQVLYGLDLARREIAKSKQVVVVEGYTDVMAAHLSGVPTAVATCGTAFGSEHARIVRRILGDVAAAGGIQAGGVSAGGEIIFTFDGDEAGRKAALRAFTEDQSFLAQTFVAVEPSGVDPCDLRLTKGPEAIKRLVASRVPLFEFVIRSTLATFDINTAEGRIGALRAAAPVVAGIRDRALRPEYERSLAGWLGIERAQVSAAVRNATSGNAPRASSVPDERTRDEDNRTARGIAGGSLLTSPDPAVRLERQAAQAIVQHPELIDPAVRNLLSSDAFTIPALRAVYEAVAATGWPRGPATTAWLDEVKDAAPGELAEFTTQLAVLPLAQDRPDQLGSFVTGVVATAVERRLVRQIGELRGAMQRAGDDSEEQNSLFAQLMELESQRRKLRAE